MGHEANDVNPAKGLAGLGAEGTLKIPPDLGRQGVMLCHDAAAELLAVQSTATAISKLQPFSNLGSGAELASKFSEKGDGLGRILSLHLTILDDLANAFKAAARAYEGAESASKREFYDLEMPTEPGKVEGAPTPPDLSKPLPVQGQHMPDLSGALPPGYTKSPQFAEMNGELDNWMISGETPSAISESQYLQMQFIRPDYVTYVAESWRFIGKGLTKAFGQIQQGMSGFEGQWDGYAKKRAVDASQKYGAMTQSLGYDVEWIARNLDDTAGWLGSTRQQITTAALQSSAPVLLPTAVTDTRPKYYPIIEGTYNPGLESAALGIPVLHAPDSPVAPNAPGNGRPGAPGNGSPGNGSPGSGALSNGAAQALSRQAQQAQLAQANATAQRAAEQARDSAGDPNVSQQDPTGPNSQGGQDNSAQQALQGAQQALQAAQHAGMPSPPSTVPASLTPSAAKLAAKSPGAPGPGPGLGTTGAQPEGPKPLPDTTKSALFPRASVNGPAGAMQSGLAATSQTPGPAGAPGQGGGQQQQNKEHKAMRELRSAKNFDEAIGDPQVVSSPVVE
ncbi:hypothetical protein [Nocardia callitridis]|uniref:ESX-1 secretion-associated protein EspB PE domain-containing protein n=1 Tax=Nocardia callitridis TaxID=648753 RepID=A0ABP9KC76_9NOCA